MNALRLIVLAGLLLSLSACTLVEVSSQSKVGPEWRRKGAGADKSNNVRWYAQQGIALEWHKGIKTAVTYRRRDEDNGSSDHDNGLWFELTIPLWQAHDHPVWAKDKRIKELEERLALLESKWDGAQE